MGAVRQRALMRFAACLLVGTALVGSVRAADVRGFIAETQQSSTVGQQLTMAWWIPAEFWDVSLAGNPNVTPDTAAQVHAAFQDYQVFALLRANTGLQGLSDVASKADLLSNGRLEVDGKVIAPIDPDKVPAAVQTILGAMKPLLAGMLGQMGQSIELIVYPATSDGHRITDPMKPGSFQYTLFEQTFHWRLPLASLLPKKIDRKSKEEFPGNYDYNPYTGDKLSLGSAPVKK
jgi:hypothetical protein